MKKEGSSDGSDRRGRKRERQIARRSTSGPAPRKMLGEKGRKYFYDLHYDGKIKETQCQTHPSRSDAQQQVAPEMKTTASQTDFNSRFYVERSDRMARGEPSPYANSESE